MARNGIGFRGLALCGVIAAAAMSGAAMAETQEKSAQVAASSSHVSTVRVVRSGSAHRIGSGIESIQRGEQNRLIQSGSPTVIRSFRPREGVLQSPAPAGASQVQQIGASSQAGKIVMVDEASARSRQLVNDAVVAERVGSSLTRDGMILVQTDAKDVQPLIAVSPTETIDARYRAQLLRDHPYITDAQARRAEADLIAAQSQWQRETGLAGRVMQFNNADAKRMYAEETRRAVNYEPSAIIVPRDRELMSQAEPVRSSVSTAWTQVPAAAPVVYAVAQPVQPVVVQPVVVQRTYVDPIYAGWDRASVTLRRSQFYCDSGISISFSTGKWGHRHHHHSHHHHKHTSHHHHKGGKGHKGSSHHRH